MAERSILIIGAGIGGLSTACYACLNGYAARVVEMHTGPGGVCTSWRRGGYVFDGSIHNLAGTAETSAFDAMWRELGVFPALRTHAYEEVVALERPGGGEPFIVYTDLDRLEANMMRLFPTDAEEIKRLLVAVKRFANHDLLALALATPAERLRALGAFAATMGVGAMTLERYAQRFSDPFLRQMFPSLIYDWPKQSMFMLLHFMARMATGDLGWPMGGSAALAQAIERRVKSLGGEVNYQARAESIIVEGGRAVGVRMADGSDMRADIVVSNAYGPQTIFQMLGGRYKSKAIEAHYKNPQDRVEMGLHVSLGVTRDLSKDSHAIVLPLGTPVEIDGEMRTRLYIQTFGYDQSMAPSGKGVMKVLMATNWSRWDELAQSHELYEAARSRIAETVIGLLSERFPGLATQVEVADVATPITTRRITGNGVGYAFTISDMARSLLTGQRISQTLPGLANFYMVGQWAGVPGVPMVAAMGRDVVRQICRRDGRTFVALGAPSAGVASDVRNSPQTGSSPDIVAAK